ncbi:MAG: hypothetical protein C4523_11310 [Myxococcales bacterium]|nr:MAG: hypothetical protein C4523_11310 [Myxococcales bacterium]
MVFLLLVVFLFLVAGCGGEDFEQTDGDGETAVDGDDDSEVTPEDETEGEAEDETAEEPLTGLRLVQLTEQDLTTDGGHEAVAIAGDYLLANEKVRFVIQGDNRPRSWIPYTGTLVDADLARAAGESGGDLLGEVSIITAILRSFCPSEFTIVADGGDGQEARLRVRGKDCGIPIVDTAIPLFKPLSLDVTLEYVLKPNDNALEIITTVVNGGAAKTLNLGAGLVWGNLLRILTPGFDWGLEGLGGKEIPYQLAIGDNIAYGIGKLEGEYTASIDQADILPFIGQSERVPTGQSISYSQLFVVAENAEAAKARLIAGRNETVHTLTVGVSLADEADQAEKADVLVLNADGKLWAQAFLPAESVTFQLPDGQYQVITSQEGRPNGAPAEVTIAGADAQADVVLSATGRVNFSVTGDHFDGSVRALPAKITVQPGLDAAMEAPTLRRIFTASGEGAFLLEPGDYTLTASRGYEYEIVRQNVTAAASAASEFNAVLERSVDTTGWIASDTHMHSERSVDTTVPLPVRVATLAATGLEVTPITDHDVITSADYLVPELGLREFLRILSGVEISPPWAHTNAMPVEDRDDRPLYYGFLFWKGYDEEGNFLGAMTEPEILASARELYNAPILQINHPRGNSLGYLDAIDYDPALGVDALPEGVFSTDFDGIELINANDVDVALEMMLPDWYSFLNQGINKAGVAVSDCHTVGCPGDGHIYLRVGKDDPNEVTDEEFIAAYKGMHAIAAAGPFIDVRLGDAGPGDTLDSAGPYALHVVVQAPSWMAVDWMRVVVNGVQVHEEAVTGEAARRLETDVAIELPGKDFWVVVLAGAPEKRLAPISPGQPILSIANPIFVDTDGNGYTPPGL